MSDQQKTPAQLEAELARLRQEAAGLRAALAAGTGIHPVAGMPGDYDLLFETLSEALLVIRISDGLILRTNPRCRQLLGVAEGDLAGKTFYDFLPGAARPRAEAIIREAAAGNRLIPQHEAEYSRPDGAKIAIEVGGAILGDAPDVVALLYLTDITKTVEAQRLLRETEQRYRLVVESAADPIFMFDRSGRFAAANPAAAKAMHRRPEELVGKAMQDLFPPEVAQRQGLHVRQVFETGEPRASEENESRTADGPRWFNTSLTPIRNDRGEVEFVLGIARDITERKRAEEALRESRRELQAVQDTMADGLLIADAETHRFVRANPGICRMLGYTQDELLTKSVEDIHPRDRVEEVLRIFDAQVRGEFSLAGEVPCLRKDGQAFFAEISSSPITLDGRPCSLGVFRDVTERNKAAEALREREAELQSVQDAMVDALVIVDIETQRLVRLNPAAYRMFGYAPGELEGMLVHAIHPPEDVEFTKSQFRDRRQGIFNPVSEIQCRRKDGTVFVADMNAAPITIGGRRCTMGVFRDITERKKAEDALHRSEEQYRNLFGQFMDGVVVAGENGILKVNEAFAQMHGMTPQEMVGRKVWEFISPDGAERARRRVEELLKGDAPDRMTEYRLVRPDGGSVWIEVRSKSVTWEGRPAFQSVLRDITERKKAEEALRQSEENYRLLFESNSNGIAIIGPDGRAVRANRAYCDIHRIPPEKMTGMTPWDLVAPQHHAELRQKHEALFRGEIEAYSGNFRIARGDGTAGWVEVRASRMTWEGKPARLVIVQDITDRVRLENELLEVQKMEAVGQLAGGIAHDFNNLLTGILCSAQLLKTGPGIPKSVYETADVIERASRRAAELTSQLLGFARRGKHQDIPVDLGATIQSVIQLMGSAIDPKIAVEAVLPPQPAWTHGDPTQMEQVVLNLAMNARDSMAGGGKLTVAAEAVELDAAACTGRRGAKPGRYVVLRVSDTGCGITEEIRDRIFEPFFTTKPKGKGTGMGLAMVYGIAKNHGGWVELESAVGRGSTFRVYLPAQADRLPERPAKAVGAAAKKGRRPEVAAKRRGRESAKPCILVVDDDEMVRKALTRILIGLGYTVITAADGREAVVTYGMFGSSVDVVIIDMAMPGMDGRECFLALHRLDPGVRAILCTGGPADAETRDLVGEGLVDFLQKPYQAEQLASAIAKALAARPGGAPEAPSAPRP